MDKNVGVDSTPSQRALGEEVDHLQHIKTYPTGISAQHTVSGN